MSVKIIKNPAIGETLTLVSFPEKPRAADVDRGYYAYNEAGDLVLCGTSKWCVIDAVTHRIQRIAPIFEKHDSERFIPYPPFDDGNPKLNELPAACKSENAFSHTVQVTDLDRNVHMNNSHYGDVVLNVCGIEMLKKQSIARLDINFLNQLFYGDRFDVCKLHKDGITYIEAKKASSSESESGKASDAVFRARVEWE